MPYKGIWYDQMLWRQWCFSEGFSWVSGIERLHCMHSLKLPMPQQTVTDWIYDNIASWGFGEEMMLETGKRSLFLLHSCCWSIDFGPGKWKDMNPEKVWLGKDSENSVWPGKKIFLLLFW